MGRQVSALPARRQLLSAKENHDCGQCLSEALYDLSPLISIVKAPYSSFPIANMLKEQRPPPPYPFSRPYTHEVPIFFDPVIDPQEGEANSGWRYRSFLLEEQQTPGTTTNPEESRVLATEDPAVYIQSRLMAIFKDKSRYSGLLKSRNLKAQKLLDLFQHVSASSLISVRDMQLNGEVISLSTGPRYIARSGTSSFLR